MYLESYNHTLGTLSPFSLFPLGVQLSQQSTTLAAWPICSSGAHHALAWMPPSFANLLNPSIHPSPKTGLQTLTDVAHTAELSLTVPIVNTLAFFFTVLGEWYVEGKVISRSKSRPSSDQTTPHT